MNVSDPAGSAEGNRTILAAHDIHTVLYCNKMLFRTESFPVRTLFAELPVRTGKESVRTGDLLLLQYSSTVGHDDCTSPNLGGLLG